MNNSLSAESIAKCCDVTLSQVLIWIESGVLPAFTLEGKSGYYVQMDDFLTFYAEYTSAMRHWDDRIDRLFSVLLIEADTQLAEQMKQALIQHGFLVMHAKDPEQLVEILPCDAPHVVSAHLSDCFAEDPMALLHVLRRLRQRQQVKVMLVTEQSPQQAWREEVDGVLLQPFLIDEYVDNIKLLLHHSPGSGMRH